jgi:multiple sugar transport system substrate-binding protein
MMRIPLKSLGFLLLASVVALWGAVGTAHARTTAKPVTITVAYQQFGPPPYFEQILWVRVQKQLAKVNPNIRLRLLPVIADEGSYYTKIDLMLRSASTAPDLIREDSFLVGSDVTAGYLAPLDKYLAAWPEYKQEWYPSMQKITTFNGHNYGVMNGTDDRLIWYNKDIFKKAGLPTTWQPRNWADILSAARTIKAKVPGVIPLNCYSGIPMDEASTMQCFEMLLYGTPGSQHLYNYKTKKWIIGGKGYLDALTFIQQVYDPKALLGPTNDIALNANAGNVIADQLIPSGKLAIDIDGSWVPRNWYPTGARPWPAWQSVMGHAKMPTEFGQAPHYVTLSGGWAYSISSKSTHQSEAFQVIKLANSRDNLAAYNAESGGIGPRKDEVEVTAYRNMPLSSFFSSLLEFTQFRPGFPAYPRISNQIDLAMENVMSGMKPADALTSFTSAVQGIVGSGNYEMGH